jgi:YD repeat-containing protein
VRTWGVGGFLDRSLEHDPAAGRTLVRDGLGHETTYRWDAAGLVTEVEAPDGERIGYRYDEQLRLVEVAWSDGSRATAAYDAAGNLVRRSERDGATWTMEYDPRGRLLHGTDPLGGRWRFHHDERGRLREIQDPAGNPTHFQFERGGCRVLDATGKSVQIGLDGLDRITEMPSPDGGRVRFAYDHRGRLVAAWGGGQPASSASSASSATSHEHAQAQGQLQTQWRWDRANRLVRCEGPGRRTTVRRTGEGEVAAIEHDGRAARIDRDAFGVIRSIDTGDHVMTYVHDGEGRLTEARQDGGELLTLTHGSDGHVKGWKARGLPHGEVRRKARGGPISALQLGEEHIELEHDAAGRVTAIDRGRGRRSTFAYRADGQLVAATNEHVTCTFERDPRGAVLEQRWGDVVLGDATPDHRGRRGGLRLGRRGRVSYLRGREGTVERIAVFAGADHGARAWLEPHELSPSPSPGSDAVPVPSFEVAAMDALGRTLSSRGPEHVVWDEDRCVAVGDVLLVHHPDEGRPLYAIDGEGRVQPLAEPGAGAGPDPLDGLLAAAFPRVAPSPVDAATPTVLLAGLLGHRAWNPQIRPIPGNSPWDPDVWGPRVDAPAPDLGRLDAETLLRALGSPFPRPELEIRSVDRRLPPPHPLP